MIHWKALLSSQEEEPCLASTKLCRVAPCTFSCFVFFLFFVLASMADVVDILLPEQMHLLFHYHQRPNAATLFFKAPFLSLPGACGP